MALSDDQKKTAVKEGAALVGKIGDRIAGVSAKRAEGARRRAQQQANNPVRQISGNESNVGKISKTGKFNGAYGG